MRRDSGSERFFCGMAVAVTLAVAAWAVIVVVLGALYFFVFD